MTAYAGSAERRQRVLEHLEEVGGRIATNDVARALGIPPASTGGILDRLQRDKRVGSTRVGGSRVWWKVVED